MLSWLLLVPCICCSGIEHRHGLYNRVQNDPLQKPWSSRCMEPDCNGLLLFHRFSNCVSSALLVWQVINQLLLCWARFISSWSIYLVPTWGQSWSNYLANARLLQPAHTNYTCAWSTKVEAFAFRVVSEVCIFLIECVNLSPRSFANGELPVSGSCLFLSSWLGKELKQTWLVDVTELFNPAKWSWSWVWNAVSL